MNVYLSAAQHDLAEDDLDFRGVLSRVGLPEVLQTLAGTGSTSLLELRQQGRRGQIWVSGNQLLHAELEGTTAGWPAVYEMFQWSEGRFEAHFEVARPQRPAIEESIPAVLLEVARRLDESRHRDEPPHAAVPHELPPPTPGERAAHAGLMLLNVAAGSLRGSLAGAVLARTLAASRASALASHPALASLEVRDDVVVWVAADGELPASIGDWVAAIVAWLGELEAHLARMLPGRFDLAYLERVSRSLREDLDELGFSASLGWTLDGTSDGALDSDREEDGWTT